MNIAIIENLIDDVGRVASQDNAPAVWRSCNVLVDQLKDVNADNITPPDVAADFLRASKTVERWAKDIRPANLAAWDLIAESLKRGLQSYVEPRCSSNCALIRGVLGNDFIEEYGEKFTSELMSYYDVDKEGDIEWKKGKLMSLWRYFESNRTSIDKINPEFVGIVGRIENQFSIRHGDKRQQTEKFLQNHTDRDYERLLDYAFMVLVTSFACLHFTTSIKPKIDRLLNSET